MAEDRKVIEVLHKPSKEKRKIWSNRFNEKIHEHVGAKKSEAKEKLEKAGDKPKASKKKSKE